MSAALAVREPGPPASVQRPIEDRGTTTLYDRVVEKVAARAALEVRHCLPLRHSIVGIAVSGRDANAAATTDGSITALSLTVAIAYPAPLQTVTREIREHVRAQVHRLCGLQVDHIDITVDEIRRPTEPMKGRVQ